MRLQNVQAHKIIQNKTVKKSRSKVNEIIHFGSSNQMHEIYGTLLSFVSLQHIPRFEIFLRLTTEVLKGGRSEKLVTLSFSH